MLLSLALLFFLPEGFIFAALGAFAAGLVAALILRKRVLLAAFASGLFACLILLLQLGQVYYPALQHTGERLEIRAVVTGNAEQRYGRFYYPLRVISVNGEDERFRLRLSSPIPIYARPFDEITYNGDIFMLGEEDPGQAANNKARGIYLGSFARRLGEEDFYEVTYRRSPQPMRPVLLLQRWMQSRLQALYPDDAAGLFRAMLLGDQSGLSWPTAMDFRIAGISHVFSVSGLHMSILAWSVFKALLALRLERRLAAGFSSLFVVFFMALTGFTASCVRAGLMMLVLLAGELFSRRADALNSLGFAAIVLCLFSPLSAGQIGMQLSFAATLGIVLFANRLSAPLQKYKLKFITEPLCVTAAALALTLPISLLRLPSGASLLAFPANMLIVPLAGPAMILSGVSAFLPWGPLVWLSTQLGNLMLTGTHWLAGLPAPMLQGDLRSLALPLVLCAFAAAAALILRYFKRPIRLRYSALAICVFMLLGGWLPGFLTRREVRVTRLDTGEGYSYFISQGNRAALIGAGGDRMPAGAAKQALSAIGARELQLLLVPGTTRALARGASEIRRDVPVRQLIEAAQSPPGYTRFSLWDDLAGILYLNEDNAAVMLEWSSEVLLFGGESPWR